MPGSTQSATLLGAALLSLLSACHLPTPLRDLPDPRLAGVHAAYARGVESMRASTSEDWYNGWAGNIWCNTWGGNRRGLCYEWQARTYEAVGGRGPGPG